MFDTGTDTLLEAGGSVFDKGDCRNAGDCSESGSSCEIVIDVAPFVFIVANEGPENETSAGAAGDWSTNPPLSVEKDVGKVLAICMSVVLMMDFHCHDHWERYSELLNEPWNNASDMKVEVN